jgi:Ni,Fe-hydrogenase III large subunit
MMAAAPASPIGQLTVDGWRDDVVRRTKAGARFAGLYASAETGGCLLVALLAERDRVEALRVSLRPGRDGVLRYPSITPQVRAAFWYERAMHDLSGVVPDGHPRLDPLLLHLPEDVVRPQPGLAATDDPRIRAAPESIGLVEQQGAVDVAGHGMFTVPFGPVRSGVFESIEFLIETPGEQIPHLNIRPQYKHRGVAKQFEGRSVDDAVLVAERVEGVSSVAHALAFSHAVESLAGAEVPYRARLIRVIHAELERMANHLDVAMRLSDAAGLAVATARFGLHKETVLRLVSQMCGNRFGRGVVRPGGVHAVPGLDAPIVVAQVDALHARIESDAAAVMNSASFLDRLRGTGPLPPALARSHGALGPVGRASGFDDDCRRTRPYDAYPDLVAVPNPTRSAGDAMARLTVRWEEIAAAVSLIRQAAMLLAEAPAGPVSVPIRPADGYAVGWAEGASGEMLYGLELANRRVRRCFARSASFHNLVLFHDVFAGDIFTDFPFIEASFGLSYAGVAM